MKNHHLIHMGLLSSLLTVSQFWLLPSLYAQADALDGRGGGIIAFTSDRDGQHKIYFMNADGSSQMRIMNTATDEYAPNWSPDGSQLAYRAGGGIHIVDILDLSSGEVGEPRLVTAMGGASIEWAPDGRIIFDSPDSGNWDIYAINADGSNLTNITNSTETDFDPDVSPDNSKIVFVVRNNLWTMDIDGDNRQQLTSGPMDFAPAWSPDGSQIAFVSGTGQQNLEIAIIDADGSNKRWVTASPYNDEFPSWSPDGLKVTYENDTGNKEKVFTANVDGTDLTQLTDTEYNDGGPAWYPVAIPTSIHDNDKSRVLWLGSAVPNPSRSSVRVRFGLPRESRVSLGVYDVSGRRIRQLIEGRVPAGEHSIAWDGRDRSGHVFKTGVFLVRLKVAGRVLSRTVVLLP